MANPHRRDPHLRVAHQIGEQLMVSHFTEQQRRILDLILRLSWGCGKKEAIIPQQNCFEIVGVLKGHIKAHLDWLIEAKVITRDGNIYSFNKDFDQWRVSRALAYTPKKVTELVTLNLKAKLRNKEQEVTEKGTTGYGISNTSEAKLDTPKERLNKIKESIYILPDWINKEIWGAFLEMRSKKRATPTDKAKQLLIKELEKLRTQGNDPNEVLNQSIMRNYTGVFPVKGGQDGAHQRNPRQLKPRDSYTKPEDYGH